jgi:hypothetical protein
VGQPIKGLCSERERSVPNAAFFFYHLKRFIRFIGQNLAYKSYAALHALQALAAPGALLSRSEQSPQLRDTKNIENHHKSPQINVKMKDVQTF